MRINERDCRRMLQIWRIGHLANLVLQLPSANLRDILLSPFTVVRVANVAYSRMHAVECIQQNKGPSSVSERVTTTEMCRDKPGNLAVLQIIPMLCSED